MVDRRDIGSWLQGPGNLNQRSAGDYRGKRLGMPEHGPGSIARFGRRLAGVSIDWVACKLLAYAFFGVGFAETGARSFIPLAIFFVENVLLVATAGATLGQRIMGMRVFGLGGRPVTAVQATTRAVLLCLFIPAVIWDVDGRGVHDKVPNTVLARV